MVTPFAILACPKPAGRVTRSVCFRKDLNEGVDPWLVKGHRLVRSDDLLALVPAETSQRIHSRLSFDQMGEKA
jgi:hypothetical protein